jgi:hypothetical protein
MADVTSGLTAVQGAAVTAVLNLAAADRRNMISAAINGALKTSIGGPSSDQEVLAAIGAACSRYTE